MTDKIDDRLKEIYRLGMEHERIRIQIKIIKQQTAYLKNGMIGGSCGLAWLIIELEHDRYE